MFLNPLGLLALLALPTVLALHLFRRRFRPRVVSAVFLWDTTDRSSVAGRKREPLRRSASLWSELLAALLLALALAGPRGCGGGEARHLVVVLDGSASMSAVVDGSSALERAREWLRERVASLPRGSRATLIASGTRPRILAGPAAFTREFLASLAAFEAVEGRHDLEPALALGAQLAAEGQLVLLTDHYEPERWPAQVELVACGQPAGNAAIAGATRREQRDGQPGEELQVTLQNFDARPRTLELQLSLAGAAAGALAPEQRGLARRTLELAPEERRPLSFELPANCPAITIELLAPAGAEPDPLAIDDLAWLAPPPARTLAIASSLSLELSRALGLASPGGEQPGAPRLDRLLALIPHSLEAGAPSGAHLLLAESPSGAAPAWCFVLESPPAGAELQHLVGPFLIDRRHPLMEGLTLEGIVWSTAGSPLPGVPIVSAGDRPLLTERIEDGRRLFEMQYDPLSSSLQRSPDWPILLANLAELRRAELPGATRTSLAIGERFVYRAHGAAGYELAGPAHAAGATRRYEARGDLWIEDLDRPGLWTLSRSSADARGPERLCELGVSFIDGAESDLRRLSSGTRAAGVEAGEILDEFTWMEMGLIAGALACVLFDFFALRAKAPRSSQRPNQRQGARPHESASAGARRTNASGGPR